MENTGKVLLPEFKDDRPEWFITEGEKWVGPLTAREIYQKILDRELTLAHFVWRPGQPGWERICDVKTFQAAVPQLPPKSIQKEVKEAVKESAKPVVKAPAARAKSPPPFKGALDEKRVWFLYYNDTQSGPFSEAEINRLVQIGQIGKVGGRVHAWREGMDGWERLEKVGEFKFAKRPSPARAENRQTPRRPLVAKILVANDSTLVVGVCRDISVGGLQVLCDRVPGPVGSRIRLNVSSAGESGSARIEPFTAEGVIVRILEDGRGFSFRFDRLSDGARRAIEGYIQAGG